MYRLTSSAFADSIDDPDGAGYIIFGVPYDATTSFRSGTRDGPRAIRWMSFCGESYLPRHDIDCALIPYADIGDIDPCTDPGAVAAQVREVASDIAAAGKVPVMLGGEHSITVGAATALMPDIYVVCDAHLDLRSEFRGSPYNHACVTRRVIDAGIDEIICIGARSGSRGEWGDAQNITVYTSDMVRETGIVPVLDEISESIAGKAVYLSIDADAIDCCQTPGVGTPEPFGLSAFDVRAVVERLAPHAIGYDYVEVCPVDAGQTAAVAAALVRTFMACHWKANHR